MTRTTVSGRGPAGWQRPRALGALGALWLVVVLGLPAGARAVDPQMQFDSQMTLTSTCFRVTNPSKGQSTVYGQRFSDGPVNAQTPAIILVHGIASSTANWDVSPNWSLARALAAAGYVVFSYDRLGYARSQYTSPGGGYALTISYQRDLLHELVDDVKSGSYSTTTAGDCSGAQQPATLQNRTVVIVGHSAGGFVVAGYPGKYHDVGAMIQTDISGSTSPSANGSYSAGAGGSFTNPDPARPDYFEFFQTTQQCQQFNLYAPGVVQYAADIACRPPFLDSPYGEIANIGQTYAENDAYISQIGPTIPVLLTSGDHDTTDPPNAANNDFAYYKAHCGCDVTQVLLPDTAHLFMVHRSLTTWVSDVLSFLAAHGIAARSAGPGPSPPPAGHRVATRSAPRGLRVSLSRLPSRRGTARVRLRGRLLLARGVSPAACRGGRVSVEVRAGRRLLAKRAAALRADCSFRLVIDSHGRWPIAGHRRLRFIVRFGGNAHLGPARSTSRTLGLVGHRRRDTARPRS